MRAVLLATDLSDRCEHAFERAVALARSQDASLHVLHVVDRADTDEDTDARLAAGEARLRRQLAAHASADGGEPEVEVVQGDVDAVVGKHAERHGADLLVVGMHAARPLVDLFRDTTAARLIHASTVPVLLVRDPATKPYRRLLAAVDFSPTSKHAVETAGKLFPDAGIDLVHAYTIPFDGFLKGADTREQKERAINGAMEAFARDLSISSDRCTAILEEGTAQQVIYDQAKRAKTDLLVIGSHARSGLSRVVLGSVASAVLSRPPMDVLVVRQHSD